MATVAERRPLRLTVKAWTAPLERRLGTDLAWSMWTAWHVAQHAASGRARLGVMFAGLVFGTGRRKRPITVRLDAPAGRVPFVLPDYAALQVLGEVFAQGEYDVALPAPPRAILDLGANIGASALFLRRRYPEARIVAVEADPQLAEILERNTAALGVEVVHAAVAAEGGPIGFHRAEESWAGTTSAGGDADVQVPGRTLDDLLVAVGEVDLVKIDVEGAEFDVLPSSERLAEVATVVGEVHAPPGTPESVALLATLTGFAVTTNEPGEDVPFTVFQATRAALAA